MSRFWIKNNQSIYHPKILGPNNKESCMTKYIFVAGGVMSGIGKGVATASIGKILQSKGYKLSDVVNILEKRHKP